LSDVFRCIPFTLLLRRRRHRLVARLDGIQLPLPLNRQLRILLLDPHHNLVGQMHRHVDEAVPMRFVLQLGGGQVHPAHQVACNPRLRALPISVPHSPSITNTTTAKLTQNTSTNPIPTANPSTKLRVIAYLFPPRGPKENAPAYG